MDVSVDDQHGGVYHSLTSVYAGMRRLEPPRDDKGVLWPDRHASGEPEVVQPDRGLARVPFLLFLTLSIPVGIHHQLSGPAAWLAGYVAAGGLGGPPAVHELPVLFPRHHHDGGCITPAGSRRDPCGRGCSWPRWGAAHPGSVVTLASGRCPPHPAGLRSHHRRARQDVAAERSVAIARLTREHSPSHDH